MLLLSGKLLLLLQLQHLLLHVHILGLLLHLLPWERICKGKGDVLGGEDRPAFDSLHIEEETAELCLSGGIAAEKFVGVVALFP